MGLEEEIPDGPQQLMEAAHIIPFSLNKFNDNIISSPEIVRYISHRYITRDSESPSYTESRCFYVGNASCMDATRLYDTHRVKYQFSVKCDLYDGE